LHFARQYGCQCYLDFGSGVGSGGILFARHGFEVTLADISSTLLGFSPWRLRDALKPGGFLYARISAETDEDRPQHIVQDFGPTFTRMQGMGLVQVWQDEWLWGHQVFQKLGGLHP
jgi:hypothetical protein